VFCVLTDIATVVGYFVVSRPFLNLANPRFLRSSHSELLEVKKYAVMAVPFVMAIMNTIQYDVYYL